MCGVPGTEDVIDEDDCVGLIRRGIPHEKIALQMPGTRPVIRERPHGRLAVEGIESPLAQLLVVLCP